MADSPSTGYGIQLAFASGFIARITNMTLPEEVREKIDVSHTLSPDQRMEYIPADLVDSGDLEVEFVFDPAAVPPIDDPAEPVTITFPSGTTWSFTGFLTNYGGEAPIDDKMSGSATLAVTGKITRTAA